MLTASRNNGLGVINETDAWMTGRPYGLPGTAMVKLTQRANGVNYASQMVGGGFGDASTDTVLALQQISTAQQAQQASLEKIAFWQKVAGALALTSAIVGVGIVGVSLASRAYEVRKR